MVRPPARRVWLAPAYVLHQYAYRDTSRIVEVFTGDYGRLTLFARGANGPKSTLRGVLRPFQRLLVSWSGKHEACQLVTAEIDGVLTSLAPERLMSGFYLNELLLKLTDAAIRIRRFSSPMRACIRRCARGGRGGRLCGVREAPAARFGLRPGALANRRRACRWRGSYYRFAAERGPQLCVAEAPGAVYGRSLSDLEAESFEDARSLRDAKRVLRAAIDACLDGRTLEIAGGDAGPARMRAASGAAGGCERGTVRAAGSRSASTSIMWRRCARRGAARYPDPLHAALLAEQSGADSITLHLREDRRHIQERDVTLMREALQTRMNLEMAVTEEMIRIASESRRRIAAWCPNRARKSPPRAASTFAGQGRALGDACKALGAAGSACRCSSIPIRAQIEAAQRAGAPVIELHTGAYADARGRRASAGIRTTARGRQIRRLARADGQCGPWPQLPQCRADRGDPGNRRAQHRPRHRGARRLRRISQGGARYERS